MFGRPKKDEDLYIIAGLGNPGGKYDKTRHNVGFDTVDALAEKYHIDINTKKFKCLYGKGKIEGHKVILMKPQTFMNLSGEAISPMCGYFKVDPASHLIVLYDDISLEPGALRVKAKGSAGGHNGMKSIIGQLGTEVFPRVKVGVGEKPAGWDLADHVLGRFGAEDRQRVEAAIDSAMDAICLIMEDDMAEAMNRYNRKNKAE